MRYCPVCEDNHYSDEPLCASPKASVTAGPWPEKAGDHPESYLAEDPDGQRSKGVGLSEPDYEYAARRVNALAGLNPAAIPALVELARHLAIVGCQYVFASGKAECSASNAPWCFPCRARAIVAEMEKQIGRTREGAE